jgi:hypothetical protein
MALREESGLTFCCMRLQKNGEGYTLYTSRRRVPERPAEYQ